MDNEQLLAQILDAMNTQSEGLYNQLHKEIEEVKSEVKDIKIEVRDTNLKIENEVSKKIEALFDGYQLNHEKQWELERRVDAIERKLGMAI